MNRSPLRRWLPATALTVIAAGQWLRAPGTLWMVLAGAGAVLSVIGLRPWVGWRERAVAGALAAMALVPLVTQWQLSQFRTHWSAIQRARVDHATDRLAGDLHAAFLLGSELAEAAAAAPTRPESTFDALKRMVAGAPLEAGVALLDESGHVRAWAGSHRLMPQGAGRPVSTISNPFYLVLEVTRDAPLERRAVGSVVVWAAPAVPEHVQSVTENFRARTGVGLRVYAAGSAPDDADIFDYSEPTTEGSRLLFSVEPIPPALDEAAAELQSASARVTAWLLIATLLLMAIVVRLPWVRYAMLIPGTLFLSQTPIGTSVGLDQFFSPIALFPSWPVHLSSSAGTLATLSLLLIILAVALWNRPPRQRWRSALIGIALLAIAPALLRRIAGGVTASPEGAPLALWIGWQLTLALAAMAVAVLAAGLFRRPSVKPGGSLVIWAGIAVTVAAAVAGLYLWRPGVGWNGWYLALWIPGLLLVTRPARRGATIAGIAALAGCAAALLTWAATTDSRLGAAAEDAARLGEAPDSLVAPLLLRAGSALAAAPTPHNASELYGRWLQARSGLEDYPARLSIHHPDGFPTATLNLDSLDLPEATTASLAERLAFADTMSVVPVPGVPGVYNVLTVRLATGDLLTVELGPRTRLLAPDRLGALLDPAALDGPPYRIALTPSAPSSALAAGALRWRRVGWVVHGEGAARMPEGMRGVHADVDLRGVFPLVVRGALLVVLDAGLLALVWLLAEAIAGMPLAMPGWQRIRRTFQVRVMVALAGFFLLPAIGFAVWEFSRLNNEADRDRDEAITQVLRDVVAAANDTTVSSTSARATFERLAARFKAELAIYQGGSRIAATDSVLASLAILAPLQDADAYQQLAFGGELESATDEPLLGPRGRVGYRIERPGPPGQLVVLAAPRGAEVTRLAASQADLGWLLLLATVVGLAAAVAAARVVAEALARPVADLRRAALALGRGDPAPPRMAPPLVEFEPVVAAFARMTEDIRQSQLALEASRRTTAAVLATVSTGVVGIDPDGVVLVANPRAEALLGGALEVGVDFIGALGAEWPSLANAVAAFLADPADAPRQAELSDDQRRLAVALAPLGPEIGGAVLAVNDVTELSRAERVLAWGEMARQVAHEIKNPLTPMRLGIQHLRRVNRERPEMLGSALDETAERILAEIERLDTIARAFSRFAAPSGPAIAPDQIRLAPVVNEVVQLYRLAGEGTEVALESDPAAWGQARADEVKEVLVNLLENARHAGAHHIVVRVLPQRLEVHDDGHGIPEALLAEIFEPHFSTTTSGTGLGLAIVRRLVDGWEGTVRVESEHGRGTVVTVEFA